MAYLIRSESAQATLCSVTVTATPHLMIFTSSLSTLPTEQRRIYTLEKLDNFRWISKLLARTSPYTLSSTDLADPALQDELTDIGQYAVLVYSPLPLDFIFHNLELLLGKHFPLEDYESLQGCVYVTSFLGTVADTPGFLIYRPSSRQLFLSFAGTMNFKQAYYDLRTLHHPHPAGEGCTVHTGFWLLYQGVRTPALDALQKAVKERDVQEVILAGHSMGGALACLLLLDIITLNEDIFPSTLRFKLAVYGAPRVGNSALKRYWLRAVEAYRSRHGVDSVKAYSVKAYNDGESTLVSPGRRQANVVIVGVPSLPPLKFGYCHLPMDTFYLFHGNLYRIPESFSEHARFKVCYGGGPATTPLHPLGGHNYYNGRDMEKFLRRMRWLLEFRGKGEGWEEAYRARVRKHEREEIMT
jgi:hypothetical protein